MPPLARLRSAMTDTASAHLRIAFPADFVNAVRPGRRVW